MNCVVPKRIKTRFSARMIEGTKPSAMPGFIKPQLAALRPKAPSGNQWLHEIKYDGYRVQLHVNKDRRTIYTRTGLDWTKRFSVVAGAFDISVERAILDGEIVVVKDGRTNFPELQAELAKGNQDRLLFYAFDLLFLEGFDLRKSPQIERKRIPKMLFDETGLQSPILYSEHVVTDGNEVFAHACKLNFEGIISKKAGAVTLGQGQVSKAGEIPRGWLREGSNGCCCALPRKAGRQRAGLHGQGGYGLVPHRLQPNPQAARYGGQPKIKADQACAEAQGHVG